MGNTETTYALQCDDIYKVKVNWTKPIVTRSSDGTRGVECSVCPRYAVCDQKSATDSWYKEIHDDGSFSLYVKDVDGNKWYLHEYKDAAHMYRYLGCFNYESIFARRYVVKSGKIHAEPSAAGMGLGVSHWYPDHKVLESLRDDSVFVDIESNKDYYAFAEYSNDSKPLELTETAVGRRRAALCHYFGSQL